MAHSRKLVLGGVALTKRRLTSKQTVLAMGKVRDDLEREIIESGYLKDAPFKWVGLIIRQGAIDETEPKYKKIDERDGGLPLSIEVNIERLVGASRDDAEGVYYVATLRALLHAGAKYGLDITRVRSLLTESATRTSGHG